ncbi:MAG TPA: hypothetical protein VGZ25_00655 [Gemmataceae bacterium]|jgi:hypothetical protein|nr:hypothetical protein [Gemmataceae bacterium]
MNCERFQNSLQNRLDGLGDDLPANLHQHLVGCSDCRSWQAAAQRLEAGVRLLQSTRLSPNLADRVVGLVLAERTLRMRRQRLRWTVGALAASVALVVSASAIAPRLIENKKNEGDPGIIAVNPNAIDDKLNLSASNQVSEAGLAVASLSNIAKEETLKQTQLFLPVAKAPLPFDNLGVPQPFEASTDSLKQAGKGVSEGLKPVTDSARRAWDLFLREVPPLDTAGKTNF